jgi:hypothetical protein
MSCAPSYLRRAEEPKSRSARVNRALVSKAANLRVQLLAAAPFINRALAHPLMSRHTCHTIGNSMRLKVSFRMLIRHLSAFAYDDGTHHESQDGS